MKNQTTQPEIAQEVLHKTKNIPEFISGPYIQTVTRAKQPVLKMLKQVRQYPCCTTTRGFTLLEFLVVVLMIGILAAVALPQYQKTILLSRYTQLITAIEPVYQSATVYALEHGEYPSTFDLLDVHMPGTGTGWRKRWEQIDCLVFSNAKDTPDGIVCSLENPQGSLMYRVNRDGQRSCIAYKTYPLANEICKQVTRTSKAPTGYGPGARWNNYRFN